jgi:hypothetical protein
VAASVNRLPVAASAVHRRWRRLVSWRGVLILAVLEVLLGQHKPRVRHAKQRTLAFGVGESLREFEATLGV